MSTKAELEDENARLRSRVWTLTEVIRLDCSAAEHHSQALRHLLDASSVRGEITALLMADSDYSAPDAFVGGEE